MYVCTIQYNCIAQYYYIKFATASPDSVTQTAA